MRFICKDCGAVYEGECSARPCDCGGSLWYEPQERRELHPSDIRKDDFSLWRYEAALPMSRSERSVTLGEGMTPLLPLEWNGTEVFVKNDSLMPTGSFKDRGVVMMINSLLAAGAGKIAEDSSGNAGASVAAYCAAAGIPCEVFVPEGTSAGKVVQAVAYGADIHQVPGARDNATLAAKSAPGCSYAGHNWHPMFVEGVRTIAYEIWEQFGFQAPDNYVCPVGNGSLAAGAWLGFKLLLDSGEIKKMPRIFGVQAEASNAIYREFHGLSEEFSPGHTIAEGVALRHSSKKHQVVGMVRATGGEMVSVNEGEILAALKQVVKKGYFIEPTSAATFAGLSQLLARGVIAPGEKTAVVISGNGLKAAEEIRHLLQQ